MKDLIIWKLVGACAWHCCVTTPVLFAAFVLSRLGSQTWLPGSLLSWSLTYAATLAVLLVQHKFLAVEDTAPKQDPSLVGKFVRLVFLQLGIVGGTAYAANCVVLLLATGLSSTLLLCLMSSSLEQENSATTSLPQICAMQSLCLSVLYTLSVLMRNKPFLMSPVIFQPRVLRVKKQFVRCLRCSTQLSVLSSVLGGFLAWHAGYSCSLALMIRLSFGCYICSLCWMLGEAVLSTVYTERVQLAPSSTQTLSKSWTDPISSKECLYQETALLDLLNLSEEQGTRNSGRRLAIFADESGAQGWSPVATAVLAEVKQFISILAATVPAPAAAKQAAANPHFILKKLAEDLDAAHKDWLAARLVQWRWNRVCLSLRTASALVCASFTEDKYGVVQTCDPNLSEVVQCLLSTTLAVQEYQRYLLTRSVWKAPGTSKILQLGSPVDQVNVTLLAIDDTCRRVMYQVTNQFGTKLGPLMANSKAAPLFGSTGDVKTLLSMFLHRMV